MSLTDVLACLTYKPASILKLNKGDKTGADADIVIFDPDAKGRSGSGFSFEGENSPWIDMIYGAVIDDCRGKTRGIKRKTDCIN